MGSFMNPPTINQLRPRLLHNWGASFLTIAQKTYHQAEHCRGPVSFVARTLASVSTPILDPMFHQWLSILSFIDEKILYMEDVTMNIFPSSSYLFSIADELALLAESFPKRFDDLIDTLAFLMRGKEVVVDIECDDAQERKTVVEKDGVEDGGEIVLMEEEEELDVVDDEKEKASKKMEEEIKEVEETCKDIIEELEKMEMGNELEKGAVERKAKEEELEKEKEVAEVVMKNAILELFDESWGVKKIVGDHQ